MINNNYVDANSVYNSTIATAWAIFFKDATAPKAVDVLTQAYVTANAAYAARILSRILPPA